MSIVGEDGLTEEERNQCREAFEKFDKDNSGAISDWELRAMLQCKHAHASPESLQISPRRRMP